MRRINPGLAFTALISITLAKAAFAAPPGMPAAPATAASASRAVAEASKTPPAKPIKRVDINSASKRELKTLPGIGDAEADRIIANRPYLSKAELVHKQVLLLGPYISVKNLVVAAQKHRPKAKPPAKAASRP